MNATEDQPPDTLRGMVVVELLAERNQLRRWLLAVTLGQATKETHAEMRDYLRRIGW